MAGKIILCFFCFIIVSPSVCQPKSNEMNTQILSVFSDFTFVGTGQVNYYDDGSIDTASLVPHGENEESKPRHLEKEVQYIFHHRAPVDNESLALRELPERLSRLGFKITKSPKSSEDLLDLVYGGPLFHIRFSDGNHEGIIFNRLHAGLGEQWTNHDYVLVYTR